MRYTFYGPWEIHATADIEGTREAFEIAGSAGSDGFYEMQPGQTIDLGVDGAEWTVELWAQFPFENPEWFTYDPVETMRHVPSQGLTTRLAVSEEGVTLFFGPFEVTLVLTCICRDPVINPPMPPNPFDFTLPEVPGVSGA
jgi:hypothetical protein